MCYIMCIIFIFNVILYGEEHGKVSVNLMDIKKSNTLSHLGFLKEHVFGITDITRTNKLSEILNSFSGKETSEIYVIQNAKNKEAAAVLSDVEYFEHLLDIKNVFEEIVDAYMFQVTMERQHDVADIELVQALQGEEFSFDEIIELANEIEIDDED